MALFSGIEGLGVEPRMFGQRFVRGEKGHADDVAGLVLDPQDLRIALENGLAIRFVQHAPQANHWVPMSDACDITSIRAKPNDTDITVGNSRN